MKTNPVDRWLATLGYAVIGLVGVKSLISGRLGLKGYIAVDTIARLAGALLLVSADVALVQLWTRKSPR